MSRSGTWETEGASSGAERAWSRSRDLWCGAGSVGRLWSAGRRPCALVASHLRAPSVPTSLAFQAPSFPLRWAPCAPARLSQTPLGFIRLPPARSESGFPFSWTRFLTWALWRGSARRAPGPSSGRRSPAAPAPSLGPGTKEPLLKTWPGALWVKPTTSAWVLLTIFFFCHRSRRRRSIQGREEPWLGAAEPCGTKR